MYHLDHLNIIDPNMKCIEKSNTSRDKLFLLLFIPDQYCGKSSSFSDRYPCYLLPEAGDKTS